jgi:hypothetical protein
MLLLPILWVSFALAEDPTSSNPAPAPEPAPMPAPAAETAPPAPKTRTNIMEVGFRTRYMSIPNGILDPFVFAHDDDEFPDRPTIKGLAFGLEYVLRNEHANGIFYTEYMMSRIGEGYWDDVEDPPDYNDGSWLQPQRLGMVVLGADGAYEIYAKPWWSFVFGGGLGLGIVTGKMIEWEPGEPLDGTEQDNSEPDCGRTDASFIRKDNCADDGALHIPAVLPIIDINIGTRFHISDRATIRLEGGLHDMFYGGMSVGVVF